MILLAVIIIFFVVITVYSIRNFSYWEKRAVKHDYPIPFFGNNAKNFFLQKSPTQVIDEIYWKYPNEKVIGFYRASSVELIVKDPDLIKNVLVNDFMYFHHRGILPTNSYIEPMLRNIFFADGDLWKLLRQGTTSTFSSGKLKAMFPLIVERTEKLQTRILYAAKANKSIDSRELMARYTTDFIGACAFGFDSNSIDNDNSEFRKLGVKMFEQTPSKIFKIVLKTMFPETFNYLKLHNQVEKEITSLVNEILKQRNFKPSGRNDFIDLLLGTKLKGSITGESIEKFMPDGTPKKVSILMDNTLITAQVFVFFAAGFETSSSVTSYTLHQLAFNPEIQKKVQHDIDRVLNKYDNKLCYEAVKEMKYLELAFKEAMRMLPSLGFLVRKCVKKYTFENINVSVDPGIKIVIPVHSIQNDPRFFESPKEFRPERFNPEIWNPINKFVYLPFGNGPRACIGKRLGLMQSLAGLAAILSKFNVTPAPDSKRNPHLEPRTGVIQVIKRGLPLLFEERKLS